MTSYNWEKDRYGNVLKKQEMWKEEIKKINFYNKEYERIKSILINKLGNPISSDPKVIEEKGTYVRNTVWETDEYYADLNMIFGGQTYRIRLKHYWKD